MNKLYRYIINFICLFINSKKRRAYREKWLLIPGIIVKNYKSKPAYRKFIKEEVSENSILLIEPNPYHYELMPGFYKYFKDLGYHISIIAQPNILENNPFCYISEPPTIYPLSIKYQKKALGLKKISNFEFAFFNTSVIWADNVRDSYVNWLNFEPKTKNGILMVEHNILPYMKDYNHTKYNDKKRLFTLRGLLNTSILNPHYFGDIDNIKQNSIKTFAVVINVKENELLLYDICRQLLNKKIFNFHFKIIGRTLVKEIPDDLNIYISKTGTLNFKELWENYKKSDFLIPMLNPKVRNQSRYKESTTTGTYQIMLGFKKPVLIHTDFASFYHLNDLNSIIYKSNNVMIEAIIKCINMKENEYNILKSNIEDLSNEIQNESIKNLKDSINVSATSKNTL